MLRDMIVHYVRPLLRDNVYTVRQGLIKGLKRKGGLGFIPYEKSSKENQFLKSLDLTGITILDVGGWEGVFAMFFARAVGKDGRVIVFEPNPKNAEIIKENIALNNLSNVTVTQHAVGRASGVSKLIVDTSLSSGTGTIHGNVHTKQNDSVKQVDVDLISLDEFISQSGVVPDFIKIDVEGFEWEVLQGMSEFLENHSPMLFIEMHDDYLQDSKDKHGDDIVQYLLDRGYEVKHLEEDIDFGVTSTKCPGLGHLICTQVGGKQLVSE